MLALLAKETAAVAPLLVLLDAWVRKTLPRKLLIDTAALTLVVGIIAAIRLAIRFGITSPQLGLRSVRHALFRSFGGLAFPWHADLVEMFPILAFVSVLIVVALLVAFFLHAGDRRFTRVGVACSAWILIGILPVFHVFFISYDLQSSRYAYLPSVGWSVLLATVAADLSTIGARYRVTAQALIIALAIGAIVGVRVHVQPWIEAARLRDRVELEAMRSDQMRRCDKIVLSNLPDNVRGAYVFRVDPVKEFERVLGISTSVGDEPGPCSFRWNGQGFSGISQ
jgi:hypothetical protein